MPNLEDTRLAFIPGARVIIHDPNTVELRTGVWNCSSVTLSDDEEKGILGEVILGLLDNHSIATLTQKLGVRSDQIGSVVETLVENNILVPVEKRNVWNQLAYLATPTLGYRPEPGDDLPAQVIVLGSATLVKQFRHITHGLLGDKLQEASEDTIKRLRVKDLNLESNGLELSDHLETFQHWRGALIVALWNELDPILLGNINRLAHHIGFTFLPGAIDGPFSIIGPTIIPQVTACFQCAEMRVIEALRDHTLYTEYRRALAEQRVYGGEDKDEAIDPFQANMVSFAAWDAINLVTLGNAFTLNKILGIYGPTLEVRFHELLRMPGCPVCSEPITLGPTLYSDLRSYLNTQIKM
ncbi:TOMM precursor leader peptide-binding protein [Dictyobacter kobayashii]|uniref:Uncharacterized protein n=1 Tax=Dictyobacter kobayashii TaxID=2014872 RepID=A0A402AQV6_9CHLR|nr:TOMM precursor leader peptide-binding protein [Dictyobacter kobayashii]GCE21477.1 hypothetical protein KDK_52770 [Dictyobacter kobayashii]